MHNKFNSYKKDISEKDPLFKEKLLNVIKNISDNHGIIVIIVNPDNSVQGYAEYKYDHESTLFKTLSDLMRVIFRSIQNRLKGSTQL